MRFANQNGRSMIEMLGVLAIIGVLSVGSLGIVAKARQQYTISQIINEVSSLVTSARKMSCDYDDGYGSYTNMLFRSDEYPDGVLPLSDDADIGSVIEQSAKETSSAEAFLLTSETVLQLNGGDGTFTAEISNLPPHACLAVATADWGKKHINGFLGSAFDTTNKSDGDQQMDLDLATAGCAAGSTLTLTYKACQRADQ